MTEDQFTSFLELAEAAESADGWRDFSPRSVALHTQSDGALLSFGKVSRLRRQGDLLCAEASRGQLHLLRLADLFAATIEAPGEQGRKAGFV